MDAKKILIVSRSFYPMNSPRSFRTTELVKEFARQGHDVTLLTLKNDEYHLPFEEEWGVKIKDLGPLRFPKVELNGSNGGLRIIKRIVRRGLHLLFEYPDIELMYRVKEALLKEKDYDLLISIAVPHPIHWGVAWARSKDDSIAGTWVADCGDPYMGAKLDSFNKLFYFKYFEMFFCKNADHITVPLESAREGYFPEFKDKIKVIPQGFDFEAIEIDQSAYVSHDVPTFAYAGGFIPGGRDPRAFLEYLVSLDMEFKFIVYTKNTDLVHPFLKKANGRIEIRDYIPRPELLKTLSKMDFLVNIENESSLMMPSKLIDYYLTGRPVLNISGTSLVTDNVNQFLNGVYHKKYEYEDIDQFRIEKVCKKFISLCNQQILKWN